MDQVGPGPEAGAPSPLPAEGKARLATLWLGGCSGCHMSLLDLDEALIDIAAKADVVYGPLVDAKEYPEGVDVALVEGAVATDEHLEMLRRVRERTRYLISFGDCAVTGNVTALRNPLGDAGPALRRAYVDRADLAPQVPALEGVLPVLLDRVLPLHAAVKVDLFLPGCPPPASLILHVLEELVAGRTPDLTGRIKYG